MKILSIESSCDETSAAVLEKEDEIITLLSNIISSSADLQEKYGGIIPEQAAREQLKAIIPVIEQALSEAKTKIEDIDAIAVTYGPGLIGSLLVGVETAKVLSKIYNKPLIPVNHLLGHLYANWILNQDSVNSNQYPDKNKSDDSLLTTAYSLPSFPCIGLLVSGGHTDLVYFQDHMTYEYLGGTRDDAAGECFDKCARLIGFPYPGGPKISKIAEIGEESFKLPRPMIDSDDFDFSFSGLKTAFANLVQENFQISSIHTDDATKRWQHITLDQNLDAEEKTLADMCTSLENAIVETLVKKTIKAATIKNCNQIIVAGGVAANQKLIKELRSQFQGEVFVPPPALCTDNAAMIGAAAFFIKERADNITLQANPNLHLKD